MIQQVEFSLREKLRGFHLVTGEILQHLPQPLPETGLLNLFVKHTSCSISINENADPDVRTDMEKIFNLEGSTFQLSDFQSNLEVECGISGDFVPGYYAS